MTIQRILRAKGEKVEITQPDVMVIAAVDRMAAMGVGALVVSEDGERVSGLLSERDVIRGLAEYGERLTTMRVDEVMSRAVPVCSPSDTISSAMAEMTRSRNRHLPVVDHGKLCGLISVGDVVKQRLEDMELESSSWGTHAIATLHADQQPTMKD